MLTNFAEDDHIFPALRAGAQGYLLKDSEPAELVQAIRQVHRDEAWASRQPPGSSLMFLGPGQQPGMDWLNRILGLSF